MMLSDENKRNRILEFAFRKFTTMGILHVTMDEISRGVGIGKGTLYKYFPSKEVLLIETINYVSEMMEKSIGEIMSDENLTTIEKLNILLKTVAQRLSKINPAVLPYLEGSIPEAYEKIVETRKRIIMNNMLRLFEDGKKSGMFQPEADAYLISHIIIGAADHIMDAQVLPTFDYSLDNLFRNVVFTILNGCLTEEGRKQTIKSR